jgi:O-antigen/teichoic acid export membrane protein
MSEKKVLFKNITSLFIVQIANVFMPMLTIPYVVRVIGPEKFGIINYTGAIVGYFILLINYAFNLTASRRIAQNKNDKKKINQIFNEVLGAQIVLWVLAVVIFIFCIIFLPVFQQNLKVFIVTFLMTVACVLTPDWLYQGMGNLQRLAFFNLFSKIGFTIIILFLIKNAEDFFWQPLALSIVQIMVTFISLRWAIFKYNLKIKIPALKAILEVLNNDKTIFFSSIVISLYTTTNIVILGSFASVTEVGYFTAAQKFIILSQSVIIMPLTNALFPFIGGEFSKGEVNGINVVKKIAPYIVFIMFLLGLFLVTVGSWFIGVFYGDSFERSKLIFRVMAFIPFIISISNLYGIQIMLNLKLDKVILKITSIGAIISLCINALMVQYFGGFGAASAWLITELFITISMGFYLYKIGIQIFSIKALYPSVLFTPLNQIILKIKKQF